jgi:hypothetical protein
MSYSREKNRMGMSAIAAIVALSTAPLAAQDTPSPGQVNPETPAEATTPAPTSESAIPITDPLAPAAEPENSISADSTAVTESVENSATPSDLSNVAPARTVRSQRAKDEPAPPSLPAMDSIDPEALDLLPVTSADPAEIASIPEARPVETTKLDGVIPIAGGAGMAILALAGAGLAVRRRKRRRDQELLEEEWRYRTALAHESQPKLEPSRKPPAPAPEPPQSMPDQILETARPVSRPPASKPVTTMAKSPLSLSFSYSGTPTQLRWTQPKY